MTTITPIFASERTAARLLDMSVSEFQRLVSEGALPEPEPGSPPGLERWHVPKLERIICGDAARYGATLDF